MKTVLGIDQIDAVREYVGKSRVGLITNYSGVNSSWESNISVFLKNGISIQAIFAPEHGVFGDGAGNRIEDSVYPEYQIPIISLFRGEKQRPERDDLEGIDCFIYDIQDVGLRYYTYIYTLGYCMEIAAEYGLRFLVLDRPNPLGDSVCGGVLQPEYQSFIGDYGLTMRYGLTAGEFGYYLKRFKQMDLDYSVIAMKEYKRAMLYPETGLLWNIPSPALADFESVLFYSGGCLAGATTLSEGRGSSKPFQIYGAPYIRMNELYRAFKQKISADRLDGIAFRERAFMPVERKYMGQICYGMEFAALKHTFDFIPVILLFMKTVAELYPESFCVVSNPPKKTHMSYLCGNTDIDAYLAGKRDLEEIVEEWKRQSADFRERTEEIRIYKV